MGRLPISQANPDQKENFLNQERRKRSEYLQKFLSLCSSSKVQVETVLIESDMEAKAILDLIPILNIRKLVLGATKSTLRCKTPPNHLLMFLLYVFIYYLVILFMSQ